MNLKDKLNPDKKKIIRRELLVIHEENNKEDDSGKCAYYETKDHFRVLRGDFKTLEQYGAITISREEKESGIYIREENEGKRKIPDDANALFAEGETKHKSRYVARYCTVSQYVLDKTGMNNIEKEDNLQEPKKKKKGSIFFWGMLFPRPVCYILNNIFG